MRHGVIIGESSRLTAKEMKEKHGYGDKNWLTEIFMAGEKKILSRPSNLLIKFVPDH